MHGPLPGSLDEGERRLNAGETSTSAFWLSITSKHLVGPERASQFCQMFNRLMGVFLPA